MLLKYKKIWITLLIFLVILGYLISYIDPHKSGAIDYINNSDAIKLIAGDIEKVNLRKTIMVSKSSENMAHRIYQFYVKGNANNLFVEIQINLNNENKPAGNYFIKSTKKL